MEVNKISNLIQFSNNPSTNLLAQPQQPALNVQQPDTFEKKSGIKEFASKYATPIAIGVFAVSLPLSAVMIGRANKKMLTELSNQMADFKNSIAKQAEDIKNSVAAPVQETVSKHDGLKGFAGGVSAAALVGMIVDKIKMPAPTPPPLVTRDGDTTSLKVLNTEDVGRKHKPNSIDAKNPLVTYEKGDKWAVVSKNSDRKGIEASIMETKSSNLLAVANDGKNVMMTYNGKVTDKNGELLIKAGGAKSAEFKPIKFGKIDEIDLGDNQVSAGEGAELVIGMEKGRFVNEIVASIEEFQRKVQAGEIPLPQFVAEPGAEKLKIGILSGGFGSRAEYTNAASSGIFDGEEGGAQTTKGAFRTPTGLTLTETTLISLHRAGLVDCSKEVFGIGKNVKFYLNKSGNLGNGGFTVNMYDKVSNGETKAMFIFPNDSMSRMPEAIAEAAEKIEDGSAAVAMISKCVPAEKAKGNLGIMQINPETKEILAFAEKPKVIDPAYLCKDDKEACLTNTFQFAVSKEAFAALDIIEEDEGFRNALKGKDARDWSNHLIPIIMVLTKFDDPQEMRDKLTELTGKENKPENRFLDGVAEDTLLRAKAVLGNQKVYAVPTREPWVDAGQLDAMYDVMLSVAQGQKGWLPFD